MKDQRTASSGIDSGAGDTVVGVFPNHAQAQGAIEELRSAGFREEQIGVTARDEEGNAALRGADGEARPDGDSKAKEGAVAGLATGAGVGTLWGLGVVAGVIPAIGPAIAGGTLAALLSSAAAGAATAGLAGTLIGLGIPENEAEHYENEFRSGRVLVTVAADGRRAEALSIMQRHGHDMRDDRGTARADASAARRARTSDEGRTLEAREEQLRVRKETVPAGEVDIHKEVRTEHQTIDVPVEKEELVIERRPTERRAASGPVGGDEHLRVPLSEEKVSVEKEPVVTEEVNVRKRASQRTERVDADVRKEKIRTDRSGRPEVRAKPR